MGYRIFLLVLLIGATLYTAGARSIPMDPWTAAELVNAQTLPTVYGITLCVALIALMLRRTAVEAPSAYRMARLGGIGVLVVVFILALSWVNVWLALGALIALAALWLGERRWLPLLALSALVPLLGYLGIEHLLGLYLPG